jgi:hypothetical protein
MRMFISVAVTLLLVVPGLLIESRSAFADVVRQVRNCADDTPGRVALVSPSPSEEVSGTLTSVSQYDAEAACR